MRRGFFLDVRAQSSDDLRRAARRRAEQRERLTSIAWERVRQLQSTPVAAIVMWASSNGARLNDVFTNGDLLKLMRASRSVSTALAKAEALAFLEFEAAMEGSELEEAMWNWGMEEVEPSEVSGLCYENQAMSVDRVRRICWGDFLQHHRNT